jgi:DNA-binding NarL/FixJ family response regulator
MIQKIKDKPVVLVVDDSPDSLGMIHMALEEAGLAVLIALNGAQAISIMQQITPDVILLDAMMPVMDGFETAKEIRTLNPLTPIIFMTGLSEVEHIVTAFESGGNDYIVKPIKAEELLVRIRQHTASARMISEARNALDMANQHVFCVNGEGSILWSTPQAHALLEQHELNTPEQSQFIAQKIRSWLPNGMSGHDLAIPSLHGMLSFCFFKQANDDEYLIKTQVPNAHIDPSILEESFHVTHREAEVLLWIAHGKTNREIAEILDLSPRTINKHLEQIYPKIGVDNRTAAASLSIQCILGGALGKPNF